MIPELELAWAAGMFEGEGSILISKPQPRNMGSLCVDLVNTDAAIPAFFLERFGGSVKYERARGMRREHWRWRCSSRQGAAALRALLPYFRTRKYIDRALLAIEFQSQKVMGGKATDEYRERQHDYHGKMAALNVRGARGQLALSPSADSFRKS